MLYDQSEAVASRSSVTCFRCGEKGHYRSECYTYKIRMCTLQGTCDPNCPFAHSAAELRRPWMAKCVRVVKMDGTVSVLGCGRVGHTYRMCPYVQHQSVDTSRTPSTSNCTS